MDRLLRLAAAQGLIAACVLGAITSARAATPEVRGTWLTTTNEDHIRTGTNTATVMRDLRNIGLNTAYVETWKNGYTNFPSQVLKGVIQSTDRHPNLGTTRDLVQETLIQTHRNGMVYYGWFEYGAMAQYLGSGGIPSNPLAMYMRDRGWLLQNQAGQYADNSQGNFAYMNIAVPAVRQFIIDMTLEAVNRYDLDGIQFDDHLAWPSDYGFDATTISLYTSQTGNPPPSTPSNSQFTQWRMQKVNDFASQFYGAVKTARPELAFSIAPETTPYAANAYNVNWPAWVSQGPFDDITVQLYRTDITSFNKDLSGQLVPFQPNHLDKLVVGLRAKSTPSADLQQMIARTRSEGAAGHSLWYSAGTLDEQRAQLTSFYNVAELGQASNPNFAADRRPLPIMATLSPGGSSDWRATVTTPGRYRVVARLGSGASWVEIAAVQCDTGTHQFDVPTASQVELLVDHRTSTSFLGDFNGDQAIDGADLLAWQRGLGQTVFASTTDGDSTHDGKVDGLDLRAWRFNFGVPWATDGVVNAAVPEPTTPVMLFAGLLIAGLLARRTRENDCVLPRACQGPFVVA